MVSDSGKKTLGKAIDEIIAALESLPESARATAIRAACEHLGVPGFLHDDNSSAAIVQNAGAEKSIEAPSPSHSPSQPTDIRTLKAQKQPGSATEMACVVAYYLESLAPAPERKREISSSDLDKYFKQAGYPLSARMPQVLVKAKASGYFDSAGHGKYKLNPVGHNLVVHSLPKTKK